MGTCHYITLFEVFSVVPLLTKEETTQNTDFHLQQMEVLKQTHQRSFFTLNLVLAHGDRQFGFAVKKRWLVTIWVFLGKSLFHLMQVLDGDGVSVNASQKVHHLRDK